MKISCFYVDPWPDPGSPALSVELIILSKSISGGTDEPFFLNCVDKTKREKFLKD